MDGTFEVVPSIMRPLYGGETVPFVFCIISSKSKEAYTEMLYEPYEDCFRFLKSKCICIQKIFPSSAYKKNVKKLVVARFFRQNHEVHHTSTSLALGYAKSEDKKVVELGFIGRYSFAESKLITDSDFHNNLYWVLKTRLKFLSF